MGSIYPDSRLFLTHSATGALEMAALLLDIQPGDEVILPSFTYVSSITPFVLRGAIPVFVDINPDTLNMDDDLVESAITDKTKAILCMHYGGFPNNMHKLRTICDRYGLPLVEDAAMGFGGYYQGKPLGSLGDFGAISFDITKHISAIQGGLLLVNNPQYLKRAEAIYHVGTNRTAFMEGEVPYFEWVDVGSKYQMPEMSAAVLEVQLRKYGDLLDKRNRCCVFYENRLRPLAEQGFFKIMSREKVEKSVHLFYLVLPNETARQALMEHLRVKEIEAFFHYIPLHTSHYGGTRGRFVGFSDETSRISGGLLRLPVHADMDETQLAYVCETLEAFYSKNG